MPLIIQNTKQDLLRLSPDEIIYIKSDGNYCNLWLYGHEEPIELWMSLTTISDVIGLQMQTTNPKLVRTGKQYILNIDYVCRIDLKKDEVTLWRKGMNNSIVIDEISHKALSKLSNALLNNEK